MQATYCEINPRGRVIAVSDIHGNPELFQRLLNSVGFCSDDTLVIVGDLIERGPDSLGTVRLVMELMKGGNVYVTQGNRDYQITHAIRYGEQIYGGTLREYLEWGGNCLCRQMLAEMGIQSPPGFDPEPHLAALCERFEPELSFLHDLPTVLRAGRYVFVHAGLTDPDPSAVTDGEAWSLIKNDCYLLHPVVSEYWQVVGHTPTVLYHEHYPDFSVITDREHRVISMDGGVGIKAGAQLNAVIIPDAEREEFEAIHECDLPIWISPVDQEASEGSVYIKWPDNYVDVLRRKNGLVYLRHHGDGKRLWAPEGYLFPGQRGRMRVRDITDYRLPVFKGEYVFLLKRTASGALCKKADGRVGWIYER